MRVNRVTTNDEVAFEGFVLASGPALLRAAHLITGDHGLAEDALQTALERVARKWSRVKDAPEQYARRVVINAAIDQGRHRRARPVEVAMVAGMTEPVTDDSSGVIGLRSALVDALKALPVRQRSVVVCRYVLDLDERQTAEALNVGVGTVKASASRGLASLRTLAPSYALTPPRQGEIS